LSSRVAHPSLIFFFPVPSPPKELRREIMVSLFSKNEDGDVRGWSLLSPCNLFPSSTRRRSSRLFFFFSCGSWLGSAAPPPQPFLPGAFLFPPPSEADPFLFWICSHRGPFHSPLLCPFPPPLSSCNLIGERILAFLVAK